MISKASWKTISWAFILVGMLVGGCEPAVAELPATGTPPELAEELQPTPSPEQASEASQHYEEGREAMLTGELESALESYNAALEVDPDFGAAYFERGRVHAMLENFDQAIEDLNRSLEYNPGFYDAHFLRAWAYFDSGQDQLAIQDFDLAIEIDPDHSANYYGRGNAYANLGETELALQDLELALELGLSEYEEGVALAVIAMLDDNQGPFDGTWVGTTGQGQLIELEIANSGLQSYLIGFSIPGCEGDSPMSSWLGTPEFYIEDGALEAENNGLYQVRLTADFTVQNQATGTLEFTSSNPCGQGMRTDWAAVPELLFQPPALSDELAGLMPELALGEDMASREEGSQNFQDYSLILGQEGDWYLLQAFDSIIAVPAGWSTLGTGSEDLVLAYHQEGLQYLGFSGPDMFDKEPEAFVNVGGYWGSGMTGPELIAQAEAQVSQESGFSVLGSGTFNSKSAYILFRVDRDPEVDFYRIWIFTQVSDGSVRGLDLVADAPVWEEYYPIFREIAASWASSQDYGFLGGELPENLLE